MTDTAEDVGATGEQLGFASGILSNASWLTFGRLAGDVLGFLLFVVLSRRFGPAGIGQYAYGFAVSGFVYVSATLGLEDYGVREFARLPVAERRRLLGRLLITQFVLLGLLVLGLLAFLLVTRASPEVGAIILLFSGYQIALAVSRTLFVPAFAAQCMVAPALTELICRGLGVAVSLVLVLGVGASLLVTVAAFPAAGALLLIIALRSPKRHLGSIVWTASRQDVWSVVHAAWPFAAAEVVFQFYARADVILVLWIVGEAAAGIYASAFKFVEVGLVPLFFLGLAAYPGLTRLGADGGDRLTLAVDRMVTAVLFVSGLVAWGLVFVVPNVVTPLLGERFQNVGGLVRIMATLPPLMAIEIASTRVLLASHLQVTRVTRQASATGINVALNLLLIPYFGAVAAACSAIVGLIVADVLYLGAIRDAAIVRVFLKQGQKFIVVALVSALAGTVVGRMTASLRVPATISLMGYAAGAALMGLLPHEAMLLFAAQKSGRDR